MMDKITVSLVRTMDELVASIAIRAAVYVGEDEWSFEEEWDGNDFTGSHILARVNGDPAGCLRVRYFADFIKPERLAVLPKYRNKRFGRRGVAWELCDYTWDFALRKGFTKIYGHALEGVVPLWHKLSRGALYPMHDESFECNGKTVVPMAGSLPPVANRLSLDSSHLTLVRPEGAWDRPGFWETPTFAVAAE